MKKPFTLYQFVMANDEIVSRYHRRIEELRRINPLEAARKEQELEDWIEQVEEIFILPILEQFRQVKRKLKNEKIKSRRR